MVGEFVMRCSPQVGPAIDRICAQGCEWVSAYIVALKNRESRPECAQLDEAQQTTLLMELQAIMAVYEENGF
jgi:hypothetical protein